MRIVFLIETLQLAGAERVVLELAQAARSEGCAGTIVTLRETSSLCTGQYGDVAELALFRQGKFNWPWSAARAAVRLRRMLARLRPDVVAIHAPRAAVVAALAGIRVPTLWVLHGHDVCWDGTTARRRLSRALQRWTCQRLGGRVAAVSPSLADHAARGLGIALEEIIVNPNGVDTRRFRFEDKTPSGDLVVCMLGRLVPWKGPEQALEAFGLLKKEFPVARLWFVGDGPSRDGLAAEVETRGWTKEVTFWGMVRKPEDKLREATVLWHLSESEGFGLACAEAMASGCPVVGFDVRGVRDLLKNECGVLTPVNDTRALARQTALLVRDGERCRRIARAARARVESRYSLERMCAGHYELMRRICGEADPEPQGDAAVADRGSNETRLEAARN